jgi:hypothetical protein
MLFKILLIIFFVLGILAILFFAIDSIIWERFTYKITKGMNELNGSSNHIKKKNFNRASLNIFIIILKAIYFIVQLAIGIITIYFICNFIFMVTTDLLN